MSPTTGAELLAAALVLAAYVLAQRGLVRRDGAPYLLLNWGGSTVFALLALIGQQWGFLLLNGVWSLISLWGLVGLLRRGPGGDA